MASPPLEPTHPPRPPALGSSGDTKSLGPLLVGITAHIENPKVIAAPTQTHAASVRTQFARMLRGNPNVMFCRLAGGSEQAAVCNVSSPNTGPACPARLSIA
jgi:hypothetical protein